MSIVSKFTVASDEGLHNLFVLKEKQIRALYTEKTTENVLNEYIKQALDQKVIIDDLNNLSTQMITAFTQDKPVGYVIIKQSKNKPVVLQDQKAIQIDSFYSMPEYGTDVSDSLWKKCLSASQFYDVIWIEILQTDPLIPFIQSCGFKMLESSIMKPFDLPSYVFIRYKA